MCEPVSIVSGVLAVGSAVASHRQQSRAARQQASATREQTALALMDSENAQIQANEDSMEAMSDRALEARRELALVQTISGEYGGGNTAARLATDALQRSGQDAATLRKNSERQQSEFIRDRYATIRTGQSRLASIQRPSWLGTGLQIGSAAVSAYGGYRSSVNAANAARARGTP